MSHVTTESVLFDAVLVPGGDHVDALLDQGDAKHFVAEAFKHKKPVAALGDGVDLVEAMDLPGVDLSDGNLVDDAGVVTSRDGDVEGFVEAFVDAIAEHRHWDREDVSVPA